MPLTLTLTLEERIRTVPAGHAPNPNPSAPKALISPPTDMTASSSIQNKLPNPNPNPNPDLESKGIRAR